MENGDLPIMRVHGLKHRIGHGMIAPKQDRDPLLVQRLGIDLADQIIMARALREGQVTLVDQLKITADFHAVFACSIPAIAP